jgi:hypothetical protein
MYESTSSFSLFVSCRSSYVGCLLVQVHLCNICIDLCIALDCTSLHVFRLFASHALVFTTLPFRKPSFGIWSSSCKISLFKSFRKLVISFSFLRNEDFSSSYSFFDIFLFYLSLFFCVRKSFIEEIFNENIFGSHLIHIFIFH